MGRPGVAGPVRPGGLRGADGRPPRVQRPAHPALPFAGAVTAVIAVLVGLTGPAHPRPVPGGEHAGLRLSHAARCSPPRAGPCRWWASRSAPACPTRSPRSSRPPSFLGLELTSERAFAWFSLAVLVVSVLMVRVWRDRGIARRLIAVRDNETGAGATGIPVVRTKLMAFALSGFIAGYAGVCLAFATERFSTATFDPSFSILVVSMVVIGGLDSIAGAVLGALYLVGLPALFGTTTTIQFLTSGIGLMAFILYLPGGMADVMHRLGDLVTVGLRAPPGHPEGARPGPTGGPGTGDPEPVPGLGGGVSAGLRPAGRRRRAARTGPAGRRGGGGGLRWAAGRGRRRPGGRARDHRGAHRAQRVGQDHPPRHLSGLVTPAPGTVRLDGGDLADYLPEERASARPGALVPGLPALPRAHGGGRAAAAQDARRPVGVLATTLQLPWARRSERDKRTEVDGVIGSFGLDRFRHHRTGHLSTGTRRVVDLASIVLARPRLLLLDEPTAGIAQREAEAFIPAAAAAARGDGHHHRAGRARRAAGLRPVHEGGHDGDRARWCRRARPTWCGATPGRWPPTSAPATRPWPCRGRGPSANGAVAGGAGGAGLPDDPARGPG